MMKHKKFWSVFLLIAFVLVQWSYGMPVAVRADTNVQMEVRLRNANNTPSNDTLFPWYLLINTGSESIQLSDLKIRYYYTIDIEGSQMAMCDYSTFGPGNIYGTFYKMDNPVEGADTIFEVGFRSGAGTLEPGGQGEVHNRVARENYYGRYNQLNDYSFNNSLSNYTYTDRVAVYYKGVLISGIPAGEGSTQPTPTPQPSGSPTPSSSPTATPEASDTPTPPPAPTPTPDPIPGEHVKVTLRNANVATDINVLYPWYEIFNAGTEPIELSDLTIRYYYTTDGEKNQLAHIDYASIPSSSVRGSFHKIVPSVYMADYYYEVGFSGSAGILEPRQLINIQSRIVKSDHSRYNQANDYSFGNSVSYYITTAKIAVYLRGKLVFGVPAGGGQANATPEILSPLNGAQVLKKNLTVKWQAVEGADSYILKIEDITDAADGQVGSVILNTEVRQTQYVVSADKLEAGRKYRISTQAVVGDYETRYVDCLEKVVVTVGLMPSEGIRVLDMPEALTTQKGGTPALSGRVLSSSKITEIALEASDENGSTLLDRALPQTEEFDLSGLSVDTTALSQQSGALRLTLKIKTEEEPTLVQRRTLLLIVKDGENPSLASVDANLKADKSFSRRDDLLVRWSFEKGGGPAYVKITELDTESILVDNVSVWLLKEYTLPGKQLTAGKRYRIEVGIKRDDGIHYLAPLEFNAVD